VSLEIEKAIVRIHNAKREIFGAGFMAAPGRVLTCAHVILDTLGLGDDYIGEAHGEVLLDFPLTAPDQFLVARWIGWQRERDAALLEIVGELPEQAHHIPVKGLNDFAGHEFHVIGFPFGWEHGVWSFGKILRPNARGHIQIQSETAYSIQRGYSGTLVWDATIQEIAGIIIEIDRNVRETNTAYFIPGSSLVESFPEIVPEKNNDGHRSFQYACFISYPEPVDESDEYVRRLVEPFHRTLSKIVKPLLGGMPVFLPPRQVIEENELAKALCESACMIIVFTPQYLRKDAPRCAREYRAMEILEQERLRKIGVLTANISSLIIPIHIFDPKIVSRNIFESHTGYDIQPIVRDIIRDNNFPEYDPNIIKIAEEICRCVQTMVDYIEDPCGECGEYQLPDVSEIQDLLDSSPAKIPAIYPIKALQ